MSTGEGYVTVVMDIEIVVQECKCKRLRVEQAMQTASSFLTPQHEKHLPSNAVIIRVTL